MVEGVLRGKLGSREDTYTVWFAAQMEEGCLWNKEDNHLLTLPFPFPTYGDLGAITSGFESRPPDPIGPLNELSKRLLLHNIAPCDA